MRRRLLLGLGVAGVGHGLLARLAPDTPYAPLILAGLAVSQTGRYVVRP